MVLRQRCAHGRNERDDRHHGRQVERQDGGPFRLRGRARGILANVFLIAFFALQASHPEVGISLGSANDLLGSLGTAFMIPVTLSEWLPDRSLRRITRVMGVSAMVVLVVGGPLLVLGLLLPWMSWPQLILFGAILAAITMLGTPFWFLLLGRHLGET